MKQSRGIVTISATQSHPTWKFEYGSVSFDGEQTTRDVLFRPTLQFTMLGENISAALERFVLQSKPRRSTAWNLKHKGAPRHGQFFLNASFAIICNIFGFTVVVVTATFLQTNRSS